MAAGLRKYVEAIPGTPLPHGILNSCPEVRDVDDPHLLLGVEWLGLGCTPVRVWNDPCVGDEDATATPGPKVFDPPMLETADPITVYAGAQCSAPGWSYDDAVAHAEATLALGEQGAVEEGFWTNTLTATATDLTPAAGPVSIAQGVAVLEGCLAEGYGGVGIIHVPAGAAALLGCCNLATPDPATGQPATLAGNCVVIGAGYSRVNTGPGNVPADPGTAWLYATGPVLIRRGPAVTLPGPSESVNTRNNDRRVLVERTYVVATTCTPCAVQVTVCPE